MKQNGWDRIVSGVLETVERRSTKLPPALRRGAYPPFHEIITGKRQAQLIEAALNGNQAAEELLRQAIATSMAFAAQEGQSHA